MILWVFDYCTSRVIKRHLTKEEEKKINDIIDNDIICDLLNDLDCDCDDCHYMVTKDNVELEIFS